MTMRKPSARQDGAQQTVRDIRRATRRQYPAVEKIGIVLEGLRGETSITELCRKEGIAQSMYYGWSKEFLEAGKKRAPCRRERSHLADLLALAKPYLSLAHPDRLLRHKILPCHLALLSKPKIATNLTLKLDLLSGSIPPRTPSLAMTGFSGSA